MRKKPIIRTKSEVAFSSQRAEQMISELRERVARLEAAVFEGGLDTLAPPPMKQGKGRRPKIETQRLLERRKHLTTWLEQNWRYLSAALRKARSASEAFAAMIAAKKNIPGVYQPPFYRNPEQYEVALWQFLQSGRYHGNPRNLAAAMAGLPELSWKRSFDICSKHPYKGGVALQAYWDYMRRNFPDRLRELMEAKTPEQVKMVLAKSRTKDPIYLHLKEHPDEAVEWLKAGKPSLP